MPLHTQQNLSQSSFLYLKFFEYFYQKMLIFRVNHTVQDLDVEWQFKKCVWDWNGGVAPKQVIVARIIFLPSLKEQFFGVVQRCFSVMVPCKCT